jgi:NAD(P)-dependent dehydrogenase (short-subunit alcohol dehydrogenase family)
MTLDRPVAVVTGANRGIGLEVARALARLGMRVVLGSRDAERGQAAAQTLMSEGLEVLPRPLDVTEQGSVDRLAAGIESELGRIDVVVNNAGVYPAGRARDIDPSVVQATWEVNALGAWRMAHAAVPLMLRRRSGRIVNVSSEAGSLLRMGAARPAYNVSKAALNAVTRVLAADLRGTGILVNSVCPGWVATEMGGASAPRTVEQGAASVLWAVTLPDDGPSGGFFRDGTPLPW